MGSIAWLLKDRASFQANVLYWSITCSCFAKGDGHQPLSIYFSVSEVHMALDNQMIRISINRTARVLKNTFEGEMQHTEKV